MKTTIDKRIGLMLVAGLLWSACDGREEIPAVQQRVALQSFTTCEQLEQYIEDTAVTQMNAQLDAMLQEQYWGPMQGGGVDVAVNDRAAPAPEASTGSDNGSSKSAPDAATRTNTQVAGVDEPDFVKNDDTRIFVLSGQRLYASKSWPPQDLALAGQLQIEGQPVEMFLDEQKNQLVIFSSVYAQDATQPGTPPQTKPSPGGAPEPMVDCAPDSRGCGGYYWGYNATKITVIDAADLAQLKVLQEVYLPGQYQSARRNGAATRVVMRDDFRWPEGLQTYPDVYDDGTPWGRVAFENAIADLKGKNEQLIRAQTLDQWLPRGQRKLADGTQVDLSYNCADFHHSNASVRLGLATVVTLNLDQPDALNRTSIIGEVGEIYASQSSLYLASPHWWWWEAVDQTTYTYLHKFDISDPLATTYVASGGVAGHLLDQFSMDEWGGYLRVATTIDQNMVDPEMPWRRTTTNRVSVLAENGGFLDVIGKTADIAEGERIFSARFVQNRGFVVTFRQVDPLFTLDLTVPQAPKVVGELKVPGFSTYIHPLDQNHLLTIGEHRPDPDNPNAQWQDRGIKLTIFDVSNFAQPTEKFTTMVGTYNGSSEATGEHKAFNFFAERKLLAIPFADYYDFYRDDYWNHFVSDIRVFEIDANTGIKLRGALSCGDIYQQAGNYEWGPYYMPSVRRSVMATADGQDFVYAISDVGIRVANLAALTSPLATAHFWNAY